MNNISLEHTSLGQQTGTSYRSTADTKRDAPEESFPQRLAELRKEKGLKHESLSDLTKLVDPRKRGIARTTLRGYELGMTKPGIRELRILSESLEVSVNKLIFGVDHIDTTDTHNMFSIVKKTMLGKREDEIVEIVRFIVSMCQLGEHERNSIYKITSNLAAARTGEVKYRKLMDASQETVESFMDSNEGFLSGDKSLTPDQVKEFICPLVITVLKQFGFNLQLKSGE